MQNAQRAIDNPALDGAIDLANEFGVGVVVYFGVDACVPHATARSFGFMLDGLRETVVALRERCTGVVVRGESPVDGLVELCAELRPAVVVTDWWPLRRGRRLRAEVASRLDVLMLAVDTEHVVPPWVLGREHWAARTIRPHLYRLLGGYPFNDDGQAPRYRTDVVDVELLTANPIGATIDALGIDRSVPRVSGLISGPTAARRRWDDFQSAGLDGYSKGRKRLSPGSGLSPYLRFGQISAARIATDVERADVPPADRDAFLEEVVVRRELAANYCLYNPDYGSLGGLPAWAQATLDEHASDPREAIYTRDQFASASTHDQIWNAAQRELLESGTIHGYVRMYWGKRIIEWSRSPAEALATALWLNDRFALDGRSANGFSNIMWCFGRHDTAWAERPVLGKVRYMSEAGTRSKIDWRAYVDRWSGRAVNPS
jgi:deoxyribodipyrimidine photo-lyase